MHFNVPKVLWTIEFDRSSRVNLWGQVFSHIVELFEKSWYNEIFLWGREEEILHGRRFIAR